MKIEIVFLCDQEADCKTSPFCGKECIRTTKIEHAEAVEILAENDDKPVCHLDSPCPYQTETIEVKE